MNPSPSWPHASGEMADRIRAFDWSRTRIGPSGTWPPFLRATVTMMLDHPLPMVLAWGSELTAIHNDAYRLLLGGRPDALGRPLLDVWEEARDVIAPHLARALAGESVRVEAVPFMLLRDGRREERCFDCSFSPVRDETGAVLGVLNTAVEITPRVRAERERAVAHAALRASEEQLRLAVGATHLGVFDWDLRSDRVTVDDRYREMFGLGADDAVPAATIISRVVHPDDRDLVDARIAAALDPAGTGRYEFEHRVQTRHGERWILSLAQAHFVGEGAERRAVRLVGNDLDVTERHEREEALRRSEERFRLLVTTGTFSIYRMGPDWRWMYQLDSETLARTSGPTEDWITSYIPEDDRPKVQAAVAEAIRTRSPFELEHRVLLADGGTGWVLSRAVPLFGPDGDIAEWFGAGRDITDRKAAEAQLREREADLARVQRIGRVGGLDIDVASGLRSRRSPEYLRLHGLPATQQDETHAQWRDRVHPDDRERAERALFAALEGESESYESEYRIRRPSDGAVRWIQARADIERGRDGRPLRLVGAHLDITEQKHTQEALRTSEETLRRFGEASTDVLWIRDAETLGWTYLTPAFETIFGTPRHEALAGNEFRSWTDLILPEDRPHAVEMIGRVRNGESVAFEYRVRRPSDGAVRWLRNADFPIRDRDGCIRAIGGVGQDATSEKVAEEALRQSEAQLQVMVAELHHRTRNLIGVVGMIMRQILLSSASLPDFRARFTERLEALSRVQSLLSRPKEAPIGIGDIVRLELDALGADLASDRIRIEGGTVVLRRSSVQTLALAIHELATNARKYGALSSDDGRLAISWEDHASESGCRRLRFAWTETGIAGPVDVTEKPPRNGGYGRKLIEEALPYTLKAITTYELGADRLECRIDMPLEP